MGPVNVIVTNVSAGSAPFSVQLQTYSPAFFTFSPPNQRYVAAVFVPGSDGSTAYVSPNRRVRIRRPIPPAKAGDILELFATGFGPTSPTPPAGQVFFSAYATATPVTSHDWRDQRYRSVGWIDRGWTVSVERNRAGWSPKRRCLCCRQHRGGPNSWRRRHSYLAMKIGRRLVS